MSACRAIALATTCGVVVVSNPGVVVGQVPVVEPAQEVGWRGGQVLLTRVDHLTVDAHGRVWVPQPVEAKVRVLSNEGSLVTEIGGRGRGPGEFLHPRWIGSIDDVVWVSDAQEGRVTVFDESGDLKQTIRRILPSDIPGILPHMPGLLMRDGSLWSPSEALSDDLYRDQVRALPIVRFKANSDSVHSVTVLETEGSLGHIPFASAGGEGGGLFFEQPFVRKDRWALRKEGRGVVVLKYHGDGVDTISLIYHGADGALEHQVRVALPERESEIPVDRWLDQQLASWRALPAWVPTIRREQLRRALYVPDQLPRAYDILVGDDEEVWLAVTPPASASSRVVWLVVSRSGELSKEVHLPVGTDVKWIAQSRIYAVQLDEFDVPSIVTYRLYE